MAINYLVGIAVEAARINRRQAECRAGTGSAELVDRE